MNTSRSSAPGVVAIFLLLLVPAVASAQQSTPMPGPGSTWPAAVERTLWRAPFTAATLGLEAEDAAGDRLEVAAARGSCLRGALIGGGIGAVVSLGWLVVSSEGDLFEGPRERNFALIAVGAGALIGCALASG